MRSLPLGSTGIDVTELVFGGAAIGGIGSAPSLRGTGMRTDEALGRLDEAAELGIRVLDTANSFAGGESEAVIGRWREERERDDVLVITKVGNVVERGQTAIDLSAEHLARQLTASTRRLGRVDLWASHAPDAATPLEETVAAFAAALETGSISAWGCCNVDVREIERLLSVADDAGLPRPAWVQNRFSLLARDDERDLLPFLRGEGLGYIGHSPLAGGILAGRYEVDVEPAEGSRLAIAPRMYAAEFTDANLGRVDGLAELARDADVTTAALAIAWLLWHPLVTASIVAPRRSEQWLAVEEALALDPDAALAERIGAVFAGR